MLVQIAIGAALLVLTIFIAGIGYVAMEAFLTGRKDWIKRGRTRLKLLVLFASVVVWILLVATAGIWLWAILLLWLDVFETLEPAVYFALVAFTTLGFGDILLPEEWRLLSGMAAINGLLMIGLQTAMLIELMRQVRRLQLSR
ncbi:MAG: ion channel [Pseudomonadota bacterium]